MANRYWVGGTGSWNATTTNWSATSGGAGGASVPTSADDVFFDSASNATAYTCTLTTAPVCRSVSVVGPAAGNVTIAGSALWFIYGSFTLAATGVTWTSTSAITFAATTTGFTITTNGVSLGNAITFGGVGGGWTLGSALIAASINQQQGNFSTANFNLTLSGAFSAATAGVRTLTLGSSSITCLVWQLAGVTNLTLNAGTSTITLISAAGAFNGGGLTYYNVYKAINGFNIGDANNTFNALTNSTVTTSGSYFCQFAGNQTIGTLTVNGSVAQNGRAMIQSQNALAGSQVTLTVGTFITNGNVDFRDINFQGAASPLTVPTGGDGGNNTNITLATPKTVYWNLVAGGTWVSNAWATTSGGAVSFTNFPLIQDTAIVEDTGLTSGNTITLANTIGLGTVNMSTRTLPMNFTVGTGGSNIYGDLTLSSSVVCPSSVGFLVFTGYNKTQTITSAGVTFESGLQVSNLTTTVTLADALTLGTTRQFTLTLGTLNLNNNNLTCGYVASNNTNVRTLAFGTGQIYVTGNSAATGGQVWNFNNATNLTITGSAIVNATYSGSVGSRLIVGYGLGSAVINLNITAGSDNIQIQNLGFRDINFTGFTGSFTTLPLMVGNLTLGAGMTVTSAGAFNLSATSGTQQITSNGVTIDAPINFIGVGGTYQLQDNLTIGATRTLTLAAGTFNLNGQTVNTGLFTVNGASTKSIAFNSGAINVSGALWSATGANYTTSGAGTIDMTSASSKTFAGGGFSYPTLNQGGAGALTITGANTFDTITNTVRPATVTLQANTVTTVNTLSLNGSTGSPVTLNSSIAGTRATILKPSRQIGLLNCLVKDILAQGGAKFRASSNYGCTDAGNNSGWDFSDLDTKRDNFFAFFGDSFIPN